MKSLKLDHQLAEAVIAGTKTSTWRLFDDKDLSVGDQVALIDKVDPTTPSSWVTIGTAIIDEVLEKPLGKITAADMAGHEAFVSREAMLGTYRHYYGERVTWDTPVKILHFRFTPNPSAVRRAPPIEKVVVYADGGSRGNPGPSASGYVVYDEQGTVLARRGVYLGVTTNNQAEYTALKLALETAKAMGAREVHVYMDSLLVINQMNGIFKVKNRDLWPIHDSLKQLSAAFKQISFTQVPRELNKPADTAVNRALDAQQDVDLMSTPRPDAAISRS
ncbi:MAG TPA: reverse transcriptase-like protein [Candidatus Saccharimonadales bacterium]|nr:reverse transcriptase-like protein [Candidatus Saccharimonadales bacterium]